MSTYTQIGTIMILIDDFSCHQKKLVPDQTTESSGHLEFIPAGYTGKHQVLDICLNRPYLKIKFKICMMICLCLMQQSLIMLKKTSVAIFCGEFIKHGRKDGPNNLQHMDKNLA